MHNWVFLSRYIIQLLNTIKRLIQVSTVNDDVPFGRDSTHCVRKFSFLGVHSSSFAAIFLKNNFQGILVNPNGQLKCL